MFSKTSYAVNFRFIAVYLPEVKSNYLNVLAVKTRPKKLFVTERKPLKSLTTQCGHLLIIFTVTMTNKLKHLFLQFWLAHFFTPYLESYEFIF